MAPRSYGLKKPVPPAKVETHHFECTGCGKECQAVKGHGWRSQCCGMYVAVVRNPEPMAWERAG